jgi:hypothetical protein
LEQQEINDLKVDLAMIQKDIKQIEKFFDKVDAVVDEMSDIAKAIAVQQQLLANFEQKIEYNERINLEGRLALNEKLEDFRQDFVDDMSNRMVNAVKEHENLANQVKLWNEKRHTQIIAEITRVSDEIEQRVRKLEQSKWYAMGVIGVAAFIASMIGLQNFVQIG